MGKFSEGKLPETDLTVDFSVEGKICEVCGKDAKVEFISYRNKTKHYFCSMKCFNKWDRIYGR